MTEITLDAVAAATYKAMCEPAFVLIGRELAATHDRTKREAILARVDDDTARRATAYAKADETERRAIERTHRIEWFRADAPRRVPALRHFYKSHIPAFVQDWMRVTDPRRVARGQSALVNFILWPKQIELVEFILDGIRKQEARTCVKSRDTGATTVCMATLAAMCCLYDDFAAGVLSATEAKLDRFKDTVFDKLRGLLRDVPPEFAAGYDEEKTSTYLAVSFPGTRSSITGATGSNAFRGLRLTAVMVDEAAYLQDSQAIDAALAAVTEARLDVSTPHGIGGSFYDRAHNSAIPRIDLSWRDDPRRDEAWYQKQVATLDPVVLAQEVNADFSASRSGVCIPSLWVQAAVGLHLKLELKPTGTRRAGLDVADRGQDANAMAFRHGFLLEHVEVWSGANSDIFATTCKAFRLCDERKMKAFEFDGDGLGAGVRGDARVLNSKRGRREQIAVNEYRGSASPLFPESIVPRTNRKAKDFFGNRKAAEWWHLRTRFNESWKASKGEPYDPELIICIDPALPNLPRVIAELSQATMKENANGKLFIDKVGDAERSPNCADAIVIAFARKNEGINLAPGVAEKFIAEFGRGYEQPTSVDSGFHPGGFLPPGSVW